MKKRELWMLMTAILCTGCGMEKIPQSSIPAPDSLTSATETVQVVQPQSDKISAMLTEMTLAEKVYQMFIVTPESLTGESPVTLAGEITRNALESQPVGGLIYFADNLVSVEQTSLMIANSQSYMADSCGIGLYIAVDEEGGKVARAAKNLGTTEFSPMAEYGADNDRAQAYEIGQTIGKDLKAIGFNLDFAPVADVNLCSGNELGDRIFSDNPEVVANMVSGVVEGLQNAGVSATLKHFPGLGAEDGNAHDDAAVIIRRSLEELRTAEFVPFRSGIESGADFVMVGHQVMTGIGDTLPADLSHHVATELLREELGFTGIAVTDSHMMNTITAMRTPAEAAVLSVQAGMDIILMPDDLTQAAEGVIDAVESGVITEERIDESVTRILAHKEKMGLLAE